MRDIRLRGLAGPSNGTNRQSLEKLTGFILRRDGNDWIIPGNDVVLLKGPTNVLRTVDSPRRITPDTFQEVATEYVDQYLVPYFEDKLKEPSEKIGIYGEWGIRTPLKSHALNLFLTPTHLVATRLTQETFPFLCSEEMGATTVAPIAVNADYQQAFISIAKILAIADYGGIDAAKDHVASQTNLSAVLPTPLDTLSYVESLNTMCPASISLPLHRMASSLHFMRPRPWFFPSLAIQNIFEQVLTGIEPISSSEFTFFTKDQHLQTRAVHAYFSCAVEGVNRLTRFLNDFRTFTDASGSYDPMKMAKAHSVVRLMFADWQSINFTNSRYIKLRMVFAFLDKLANLLSFVRGGKQTEENLFKHLCSAAAGAYLAEMLKGNFGHRYHGLGRLMAGLTLGTYKKIHEHVSTQVRRANGPESDRLNYLRTLRNSTHGAFLRSNQFEDVFLASGGTICMEFTFLPLLLLWGLVSEPKKFLEEI